MKVIYALIVSTLMLSLTSGLTDKELEKWLDLKGTDIETIECKPISDNQWNNCSEQFGKEVEALDSLANKQEICLAFHRFHRCLSDSDGKICIEGKTSTDTKKLVITSNTCQSDKPVLNLSDYVFILISIGFLFLLLLAAICMAKVFCSYGYYSNNIDSNSDETELLSNPNDSINV